MPRVGHIEELKWTFDPGSEAGSPAPIGTPNLEVRVIILKPGHWPPYHRHHPEMDEGYLIMGGGGLMHIDGETFEVREGDVLLGKRAGFHNMKNTGREDLVELNFRGGRMPSGFILPAGEDPRADPAAAGRPSADPGRYVRGSAERLASRFDPKTVRQKGLPRVIATPHLELRIASFAPGDRPAMHRHRGEVDEATLVLRGRVLFHIDGEEFEAGAGDLVHLPGGAWHCIENTGEEELLLFSFLGGRLPCATEWKD